MSSRRTVSSVKKSCDRLWSLIVKARAEWRCERCAAEPEDPRGFHAHHVDGRNNHRLRFEPRNGWASCAACHRWAHDHPLLFAEWFRLRRERDAAYITDPEQRRPIHRNLQAYLELEKSLKSVLAAAEEPTHGSRPADS